MEDWVVYFAEEEGKKYFSIEMLLEMEIDNLLNLLRGSYFQLNSKKIVEWNNFLDENWGKLDDADYYCDCPTIEYFEIEEIDNEWLTYEEDNIYTLDEYMDILKNRIKSIEKSQNILNNL